MDIGHLPLATRKARPGTQAPRILRITSGNWPTSNGNPMTTIGMHYDVIPGKEEEFEKGFLGVIEHLKTVGGHVESKLYEDVASTGSYLILSQWDGKES